jgi:hypothetical protein
MQAYGCSDSTTNVNLTATTAGTTFTWSGAPGSGNITGFGNGTTSKIAETLTNHGYSTGSVDYTVTPKAGLCTGRDTIFTVYVYPKPNLSNTSLDTTLCSGFPTNIHLHSDVANTIFSWTAMANSDSVSGFGSGNGTIISHLLKNTDTEIHTVTYTIVPMANGCNGTPYNYTVTVNPTPHLENAQPSPICSATTLNTILLSDVAGGNFTWNASCLPSGSVTGFTVSQASGTNSITDLLTNTGNVVSSVTYSITPHANGCVGQNKGLVFQVNPKPVISCADSQSICSGTETAAVILNSTVTGTDFSWSAACPAGNINPCPITPGNGSPIPKMSIWNLKVIPQTVIFSISSSFNGCPGTTDSHQVTVNPSPTVALTPDDSICSGQTSNTIRFMPNAYPTTYTWETIQVVGVAGASVLPGCTRSRSFRNRRCHRWQTTGSCSW